MTLTTLSPTAEQQAIISAAKDTNSNIMINALAGTGKTTTLTMLAGVLPSQYPSLALAFNRKVKEELEKKFPYYFRVQTLNSLGLQAWSNTLGRRLFPKDRKLGTYITEAIGDSPIGKDDWNSIRLLVSAAMARGLIPRHFKLFYQNTLLQDDDQVWADLAQEILGDYPEYIISMAREALTLSTKASFGGIISFDDMIYMSALFDGKFPKYKTVLVDEAQDLSPLNHIQLQKTCTERLIVVGDRNQACYGWRGADTNSMDNIKALRENWIELPLNTTFRCPKIIVQRQQSHVPGYTAHTGNPKGEFVNLLSQNGWTWDDIRSLHSDQDIAIVCRNNAPLVSIAFKLINQQIGVNMLGRDIGRNLSLLLRKICPDKSSAKEALELKITKWRDGEIALAQANKKEYQIDSISDRAECLLAILFSDRNPQTTAELHEGIDFIFSQTSGLVTLSTIHKAKGLEWPCIIHLDPWRIPAKHVRKNPELLQQEYNLNYIAETRAKQTLILANKKDFE